MFFLQKLECQCILLNYANVGSAIVSRFIFKTTLRMANMHTVAIAKTLATLSPANLGLNLVSGDEDEGFLDDYELEDDD